MALFGFWQISAICTDNRNNTQYSTYEAQRYSAERTRISIIIMASAMPSVQDDQKRFRFMFAGEATIHGLENLPNHLIVFVFKNLTKKCFDFSL